MEKRFCVQKGRNVCFVVHDPDVLQFFSSLTKDDRNDVCDSLGRVSRKANEVQDALVPTTAGLARFKILVSADPGSSRGKIVQVLSAVLSEPAKSKGLVSRYFKHEYIAVVYYVISIGVTVYTGLTVLGTLPVFQF